jgi:mannose-1-phosphate guanylyltransferase
MEAILLVGGQGTRLRPLTINTPKPMLPVAGVPFTVHQILRARDAGVERIVLSTSYKAEVFADYIARHDLGIDIVVATEPEPLGTGGAIRFAADHLTGTPGDPVLVFNGDVITGLDIAGLVDTHRRTNSAVTLYLTQVEDPRAYGLVPVDDAGRVTAFLEKPTTPEEIITDTINAGCYVFTRSVIDRIPAGQVVSVERQTFPELLAEQATVSGVVDNGYWLDVGTPLAFVQGSRDLVLGNAPSPAVRAPSEALILGYVDGDATVLGGSTVGVGAKVSSGAYVDGSVLFDNVTVGSGAQIRNSIVGRGAVIGPDTVLDGVVVGDGAAIGASNELLEGVRIWPDVRIGDLTIRSSSDR